MYDAMDRHTFERERRDLLDKIEELERENRRLKETNKILRTTLKMLIK